MSLMVDWNVEDKKEDKSHKLNFFPFLPKTNSYTFYNKIEQSFNIGNPHFLRVVGWLDEHCSLDRLFMDDLVRIRRT